MRILLSTLLAAAFLFVPSPVLAKEKKLKPIGDYNKFNKSMRRATPEERRDAAQEYLKKWAASGRAAKGTTRYGLAQWQQAAEEFKLAFEGFRSVRSDDEVKEKSRDYAVTAEANVLMFAKFRRELGDDALDKAIADLEKYGRTMEGKGRAKSRGKLYGLLAMLHDVRGRSKASRDLRMELIASDNKALGSHVRHIMHGLLGETHKLAEYDGVRKEAESVIAKLKEIQGNVLAAAKTKLDEAKKRLPEGALDGDGNLTNTGKKNATERAYGGAKRSYDGAVKLNESLAAYMPPFALLGKPAATWTVEKAYAEVASLEPLKGKVVLLDFWNTWGPECSFPVIRDLVRDFTGKPFAVVGLTASSNVVYPERFDYDEDFRHKSDGGKRYAARLASESAPADDSQYIFADEKYREIEMEAIASFIGAHGLKWPNILIDKSEPGPKFAQATWPHTVLVDKQGRVRWVRGGALKRENEEMVKALKKVIEELMAEG